MSEPTRNSKDRTGTLAESISILARLRGPGGCPWDREQTFESIKAHTLEETYEVLDAIDRGAWLDLRDELGDLLLQVLFYAQMAEEAGYFSIEDVAANLNAKLIRRHPHVFADVTVQSSSEVKANWDSIKQSEKGEHSAINQAYLGKVPMYLPPLIEAVKLGQRAGEVGFDWPSVDEVFLKLDEESRELRDEVEHLGPGTDAVEDELGDLLFTAVNLARHLKVNPEFALRRANRKFRARFNRMESVTGGTDALRTASPSQLDRMWRNAKQSLNVSAAELPAADESRPDNSSAEPG